MYAVIDLETTGLHTSRHDRVVEIAIVHVGPRGDIEREWCTLVNPERDLGPQHIHGITAAEARVAPRFAQLAGAVAGRLRGRVPVAHNWAFDGQFLAAEFARMGIVAPVRYEAGLCTMRRGHAQDATARRGRPRHHVGQGEEGRRVRDSRRAPGGVPRDVA
ncbi:exonuclease domain-containing protein [Dactylosporangium sp. NPDC000244]|uniref:exonuclease domain-containing protein n=1 Tax=Dactylosporangium sp. NPDC000244 TaxID=3154365 RepID=UPI00332904E5